MSRDPYIDATSDVQANIRNVTNLLQSYHRIASTSHSSPELAETHAELQSTLQVLEADLHDLKESVDIVEQHGERWGIDHEEVRRRRAFVNRVMSEVEKLRSQISKVSAGEQGTLQKGLYYDNEDQSSMADDGEADRWEREEQQTIMRRQEDTLGAISGTLTSLASQAGLIGHEVTEQSEMLGDLTSHVDLTQSRLAKVSTTINNFIRKNEDSRSSWCIAILIVVLVVLLVAVILV